MRLSASADARVRARLRARARLRECTRVSVWLRWCVRVHGIGCRSWRHVHAISSATSLCLSIEHDLI
eukprot:1613679-Pleurochrysis_carterae.AAC.1